MEHRNPRYVNRRVRPSPRQIERRRHARQVFGCRRARRTLELQRSGDFKRRQGSEQSRRAKLSGWKTPTNYHNGSPCATIPNTPVILFGSALIISAKRRNSRRSSTIPACSIKPRLGDRWRFKGRVGGTKNRWFISPAAPLKHRTT